VCFQKKGETETVFLVFFSCISTVLDGSVPMIKETVVTLANVEEESQVVERGDITHATDEHETETKMEDPINLMAMAPVLVMAPVADDAAASVATDDLEQGEEKTKPTSSKRDSQDMDEDEDASMMEAGDDILGRYPIKKMKYEPARNISAPIFEKIRKGIYFHCCPCERLLTFAFYERAGCICRLLMYGVEGNPNLRYFEGCHVPVKHLRDNPKTTWVKTE
jgi:hypothetical protein